jgi:Domain of unknown function (DUF4062)/YEATS family
MRVFLSSTYSDLKHHRGLLIDTLQRAGDFQLQTMEYFGANPESPVAVCRSKVSESEVYVGFFGWRYGSLVPSARYSMTELEYRTALTRYIPTYLYLISPEVPVTPDLIDRGADAQRLERLKREMQVRHTVQTFTTPEDLSRLVVADLSRHSRINRPPIPALAPEGPIGYEVNSGHPYSLVHVCQPFTQQHALATIYIDVFGGSKDERLSLLQGIDRVVYQVHKSFDLPHVAVQNWYESFAYELLVWGGFWVRATLYFKDVARPPVQLKRHLNLAPPAAYW